MYSEPWFRKQDSWWYFYRRERGRRRQIRLVLGRENKKEAFDLWHRLCQTPSEQPVVTATSAAALLDLYLDWCQKNLALGTYEIYRHHLQSFCGHVGEDISVAELWPKHVTSWLAEHKWSNTTKAGAAQTVRTAFNWLVREGHLRVNPLAAARGPGRNRRETILSDAEFAAVLNHSRPDFVRLLKFLRFTGCRPQEVIAVEARHCDLTQQRIIFPPSEAKGKKHPRVIYLNDPALEIIRPLLRTFPEGKLFRTQFGKPWDKNKVRCRFRRLKDKVGIQYCAYHLRHTFATDALQRLDPITVATLMGHSDASTLARNYQHLAKLPTHLQEAAKRAVR